MDNILVNMFCHDCNSLDCLFGLIVHFCFLMKSFLEKIHAELLKFSKFM